MSQGHNTNGGHSAPSPTVAVQVWDPLVRITHWSVAAAVLANGLINKSGGTAHIWIGWGVLAILALRFAWGFFGPSEARFTAFLPNPLAALRHLRAVLGKVMGRSQPLTEYPSHNPAGAMMIYALWGALAVVVMTGLVMTGGQSPMQLAAQRAAVASGDWSVMVDEDAAETRDAEAGEWAEEVHEIAANLVLIFALIHVGGVALESRALGRNLLRPMLISFKRKP
jgi:cytochrome b